VAGVTLGSQEAGVLVLSGMFEALYILFYFWALEKESTTTVISLFQFAPIMGLLFGYLLLHESPTGTQFFAVILILIGTLFILKKKGERFKLNGHVLLMMLVSTAFVGIYNTLFKLVGENTPFWTAMFWQYLGIGMIGFLLFFGVAPYRAQTIQMLTKRSFTTLFVTGMAEVMNILALMATNAAILLAPVALVLSVSSVQPIFVLMEGYIVASVFPRLFDPSEKPTFMLQYVLGILLVCFGGFLIYQG
jgi:drug/metabolite transporter (DMT)-like permease